MNILKPGFLMGFSSLLLAKARVFGTWVINGITMHRSAERSTEISSAMWTVRPRDEALEVNVEYLRRVYQSNRDWYTASETKAQLLLAVNGALVTILFGALFSRSNLRVGADRFQVDTWVFIGASVAALVCAIICAALCLWSLHGRVGHEFEHLGVDPTDPASYRPEVLWYFGHLALLEPDAARERLRDVDLGSEIEILSYHVIDLAHRVFRKHRWVNAGWASTAVALLAIVAAGTSLFVHAQF